MSHILRWDGPFTFFDNGDGRWCFAPAGVEEKYRDARGLYLHAVKHDDSYFAYYVGITTDRDILSRQREHATEYLSGGYWFCGTDMSSGLDYLYGEPDKKKAYTYREPDNQYRKFMNREGDLRQRASDWLNSLHVFYAVPGWSCDTDDIKLIESAMIHRLLSNKKPGQCGAFCDNAKVSLAPMKDRPVEFDMVFSQGVVVAGLMDRLTY